MKSLLNEEVSQQIKQVLDSMENPITLVLFTQKDPCETCAETRSLLHEVAVLNEKMTIVEKDLHTDANDAERYGVTLTPSFVILNADGDYQGVKFNGIPAGHEINSFLSALVEMSGVKPDFNEAVLKRIEAIEGDVNIKVFVTLQCPHCPGAVQTAHRLAMQHGSINAEMIEAQTFPELSQKFNVSGVPKIIINDRLELVGNQPVEAFLEQIERL